MKMFCLEPEEILQVISVAHCPSSVSKPSECDEEWIRIRMHRVKGNQNNVLIVGQHAAYCKEKTARREVRLPGWHVRPTTSLQGPQPHLLNYLPAHNSMETIATVSIQWEV